MGERSLPVGRIKPSVSLGVEPCHVLLTLCLVIKVFIQPGIVSSRPIFRGKLGEQSVIHHIHIGTVGATENEKTSQG